MDKEKALKPIVTGNCSFQELIETGSLYVDKTEYLLSILTGRGSEKYFFLSRPRRFGKSLTVSLLDSLFCGQKELFKDLYIEDKWDFEDTYPVIHLDMSDVKGSSIEKVNYDLETIVRDSARLLKIELEDINYPDRLFSSLIIKACEKYGKKVVVLIDEYDNPLLGSVGHDQFTAIRDLIGDFYSTLKTRGSNIRFCFITGVTRFSQVSIFSKLNNLKDLSDDPRYEAICGYTDEEMDRYFTPYFEKYFEEAGITSTEEKTAFRNQVRTYYDGYRFTLRSPITMYNPVSIANFVEGGCYFDNYWIGTGMQSIVNDLVNAHAVLFAGREKLTVRSRNAMRYFDAGKFFRGTPSSDAIYSFLTQAGYLTLEGSGLEGTNLRYPNLEVAATMEENILNAIGMNNVTQELLMEIFLSFVKEDTRRLMECITLSFSDYNYFLEMDKERGYQIAFFTMVKDLVEEAVIEAPTEIGRMDVGIVVRKGLYYIIELKLDCDCEEALSQIKEKKYHSKYMRAGNCIHLLGINFSSKLRNIESWKEEIIRL